jgi:hypothetical protein
VIDWKSTVEGRKAGDL